MKKWIRTVIALILMMLLAAAPVMAALPLTTAPIGPSAIEPQPTVKPGNTPANAAPILVAFDPAPGRYNNIDPNTVFDLDGDLTGDVTIGTTSVTGKNGTKVQLLSPAQYNMHFVQTVPADGYGLTATLKLSQIYVAKLPNGGYAQFIVIKNTPEVSIEFKYGVVTTSELQTNASTGHVDLTWAALSDAALGYKIYRYEMIDSTTYSVVELSDLTVLGTSFADNTAATNRVYLYTVRAIKADGTEGGRTTTTLGRISAVSRSLTLDMNAGTAKLDGVNQALDTKPVIKNGRIMVPVSVFGNIGVNVTVDAATGRVTLTRRSNSSLYKVEMVLDNADYTWKGTTYQSDVPPYKSGSVVMLPLRVLATVLGYGIQFDSAARTATLYWDE